MITMKKRIKLPKAALFAFLVFAIGYTALVGTLTANETTDPKPDNPMPTIDISFSPETARIGEYSTLSVKVGVPQGYHFYSMTKIPDGPLPLQVKVKDRKALRQSGPWHGSEPHVSVDPNFNKEVEYYGPEDKILYQQNYKVLSKELKEDGKVNLKFRGQICDEKQCIPIIDKFQIPLTIEDGEPRAELSKPKNLEGRVFGKKAGEGPGDLATKGFWGVLIIGFLAGLGALITPCVFPMIPITISFFSKFSKVSIRRSITMASIYAGSIILVFTLVGIIISAIFGAAGMQQISTHPIFNTFLFLLLFVFAFNLFGLFEIRVPNFLIASTAAKEAELTGDDGSLFRQGVGVFLMAITFTLVSFTCTVGFIGIVLAAAADGQWFYPTIGMFSFSFAFALPFFFLAVFPSWAQKLQGKGGDWMVAVKVILGFIELAAAFKFLSNLDLQYHWVLLKRPFVLLVWTGIFGLAFLYLLRIFALPHNDTSQKTIGPIRMAFALVFFALTIHAGYGMTQNSSMGGWLDGWLPPLYYPGEDPRFMHDDIPKAMELGRKEGKPVFVDFTGFNCTNCRYMENNMFPRSEVEERFDKMILVSAFTDGLKPVHEQQRKLQIEAFGVATLPYYIILNPWEEEISKETALSIHPDMTEDINKYLEFLDEGLEAFQEVLEDHGDIVTPEAQADEATETAKPKELTLAKTGLDFIFPDLKTGKPFQLSSMRGGWVFVNFWASWCGPCKKELQNDFPPALATAPDIKLVTVAFDGDETKGAAISFADKINLWKHTIVQGGEDPEEAGLADVFEASSNLPISYLINPKGELYWMRKGSVNKEMLIELFKAAKEGKPAPNSKEHAAADGGAEEATH